MSDDLSAAGDERLPIEVAPERPMTEAEAQFAERLAGDLEQALGEGTIVTDVEIEMDERTTTIHLACLVEGQVRVVEVTGATPAVAYREAMRAAADLRLAGAWWQIVGPS